MTRPPRRPPTSHRRRRGHAVARGAVAPCEFDGRAALASRRPDDHDGQQHRAARPTSAAAPPTSPSCVARRAISTSSVGLRRPAEQLGHAERCEAEQEDHGCRRPQRRTQQRQHDNVAPRAGEAPRRARGADEIVGNHGDHRSHQSNDHGDVEEDVGHDHRLRRAVPRRRAADARNAAPTTTVGNTNGTVAAANSSLPPAERCSEPARTPAAIPTTSVRTVLAAACHAVNQIDLRRHDRTASSRHRRVATSSTAGSRPATRRTRR